MLWALCAAVYLTMQREWRSTTDLPDEYASLMDVMGLTGGIVSGATLTGTIILLVARLTNGPPLLREPGHWLIAAQTVFSLIWIPYWILSVVGEQSSDLSLLTHCCFQLISVVMYFLALRRSSLIRWKLFFAALLALTLAKLTTYLVILTASPYLGVFQWLYLATSVGDLALCPWLVVVVAVEKRMQFRRDWLHWVGVVTFLVTQCSYLVWTIGASFL